MAALVICTLLGALASTSSAQSAAKPAAVAAAFKATPPADKETPYIKIGSKFLDVWALSATADGECCIPLPAGSMPMFTGKGGGNAFDTARYISTTPKCLDKICPSGYPSAPKGKQLYLWNCGCGGGVCCDSAPAAKPTAAKPTTAKPTTVKPTTAKPTPGLKATPPTDKETPYIKIGSKFLDVWAFSEPADGACCIPLPAGSMPMFTGKGGGNSFDTARYISTTPQCRDMICPSGYPTAPKGKQLYLWNCGCGGGVCCK